jgi:hypothetical protein
MRRVDMPPQEIGQHHEALVENLLHSWGVDFRRSHLVNTVFGTPFRLDFWLPPMANRGPVVIECKDFGVEVKSVSNSRRRKTPESFQLLAHITPLAKPRRVRGPSSSLAWEGPRTAATRVDARASL